MKKLRWLVVLLIVAIVVVRPGWTCSFPEEVYVFLQRTDPDQPYAKYVAGRLGLLSSGYRLRHLVVAYDTLSGRGLSGPEQRAAVAVDKFYNPDVYVEPAKVQPSAEADTTPPGMRLWSDVTHAPRPDGVERKVPGEDYSTFTNCLDDAFAVAAKTYQDRAGKYGKPGDVAEWLNGQVAVFSNCAGGGSVPKPVPAGAPAWLKQDRAYQVAAAEFYAAEYDKALGDFRAIAAGGSSPWAKLARYLVARTLIRRATVLYKFSGDDAMNANNAMTRAHLAEAQAELQGILKDAGMAQYAGPARHLLDYVNVRLDPQAQAAELARRLTVAGPKSGPEYQQNVIDLTFAFRSLPLYVKVPVPNQPAGKAAVQGTKSPLLRWVSDVTILGSGDSNYPGLDNLYRGAMTPAEKHQDALTAWRTTHAPEWLVAALLTAQVGDAGNGELVAAARGVPAGSPAYATVTFERLRLESGGAKAAAYDELTGLLPKLEASESRSTINAYADLHANLSATLESFLKNATRVPASFGDADGGEGNPLPVMDKQHEVSLCGVNLYAPGTQHLDDATATVFNQRMPLTLLREAGLSGTLPGNVRFQVAHMAWTRALLLDDAETAKALGGYLAGCQPAMKPWVDAYASATTPDERRVTGLLAMMRFTSAGPLVVPGIERDFAAYSDTRANWWCAASGAQPAGQPAPPASLFGDNLVAMSAQPDPPFLTPADEAEAAKEVKSLQGVGLASNYFAREALRWAKEHPDDKRTADVLGFAERVVRNACRDDATAALNHQLFDVVQRKYPGSEWAKKYKTWE